MSVLAGVIIVVVTVAIVVPLLVAVVDYADGIHDGMNPTYATGDYRRGIWRVIYLRGVARGARRAELVEQRRNHSGGIR